MADYKPVDTNITLLRVQEMFMFVGLVLPSGKQCKDPLSNLQNSH